MGDLHVLPFVFEASTEPGSRAGTPNTLPDGVRGMFSHRFDANGDEDPRRQLRFRLRRVFLLIEQYILIARREAERHRLASLVQELIADANSCFVKASLIQMGCRLPSPDQERCIADLEDFLRALGGQPAPCATTVMHGLDSLVVQCVLLDADQRDAMSRVPALQGERLR